MKLTKALLGAAAAAIALTGSTRTPAQPQVYVTFTAGIVGLPSWDQVYYDISVTNNLGGTSKIYQFEADPVLAFYIGAPTGFQPDSYLFPDWIDNNYGTAIGPGQTGNFEFLVYDNQVFQSIGWGVSVENSASDANPVFISGTATMPEPSTWAMVLPGFVGLGWAGYRKSQRTRVDAQA